MNQWDEIRKIAIVESDDTQDHYERNGFNFLFYWKAKYPKFKISLFTIPNLTSPNMLKLLEPHQDWIELFVHGFNHSSNFECFDWDYEETKFLMSNVSSTYKKFFKAPGWTITPDYCGYHAGEEQKISKDKQAVYKALSDMDYVIFDRHYNIPARPQNAKIVCVDCQPELVHMHTWRMPQGSEPNGYEQVEIRGVPWNQDTEFVFASEAWEKGLFRPCNK